MWCTLPFSAGHATHGDFPAWSKPAVGMFRGRSSALGSVCFKILIADRGSQIIRFPRHWSPVSASLVQATLQEDTISSHRHVVLVKGVNIGANDFHNYSRLGQVK